MPIDLDAVTAIDTHVHVEADGHGHFSLDDELMAASAAYFKAGASRTPSLPEIAAYYRQRSLAAVVFTVDAHTATGHPALSSAQVIAAAQAHDDVLIPFASADPLDRPVRLVAAVLPAAARPGGGRPAPAQGPVRLRLPGHHPDRWLADFETLEIKSEARPLILKENAARPAR